MTVQIADEIEYNGKTYEILQMLKNGALFSPQAYGFEPYSSSTACWGGYQSSFIIKNKIIMLKDLKINNEEELLLNNVEASIKPLEIKPWVKKLPIFKTIINYIEYSREFDYEYFDVNLPLSYSGRLLLGYGFFNGDMLFDLYYGDGKIKTKMDYKKMYKEVLELTFSNGELIKVHEL